jgi:saccharopine dehydrogenase (NAD+, L-lysine-forming)
MADTEQAPPRLRMRAETRSTEARAPLVPADAHRLIGLGWDVTVEESAQRAFPAAEYAAAGCTVAPAGSWIDTPPDTVVLGLKELPETPAALRHRHVYFGHAYKKQAGADRLLERFAAGGGILFDLEYLIDDEGRRLVAFGYWAGYVGAGLVTRHFRGALDAPLRARSKDAFDADLRRGGGGPQPRVLVIGALGRCGRGACDALRVAGIAPHRWDVAETAELDRDALLSHDVLINTVLATGPIEPFLTLDQLGRPAGRLSAIADVTCDVASPFNALPIYDEPTTWESPVRRLRAAPPLDLIALDNLPSLLPRESSTAFSADLTAQLASFDTGAGAWERCLQTYRAAARRAGHASGAIHV